MRYKKWTPESPQRAFVEGALWALLRVERGFNFSPEEDAQGEACWRYGDAGILTGSYGTDPTADKKGAP